MLPQDELVLETGEGAALSQLLLPIQDDDHVMGPGSARLTLVEYGDYECPGCGALFETIRQLQERLENDVRIVYRHYPFSGKHKFAQLAAEAAEAADAQGKFWEMHELLFRNQSALGEKHLVRYGEQLGLDVDRFHKDLKERSFEDVVRQDFKRGVANGVYSTPGLFVNGVRYSGAMDAESILSEKKAEGF